MEPSQNIDGCPYCSDLGEIQTIDSDQGRMDVLVLGSIAVTTLHGVCLHCNREVHFNSRDRLLARLIERTLAARKLRQELAEI